MYKLFMLLSSEHPSLPEAEVKAVLEAEGLHFNVVEANPPVIVVEVDSEAVCGILEERLAMTMDASHLLFTCRMDVQEIEKSIRELDMSFIEGKSFAVRVDGKGPCNVSSIEMEKLLGAVILRKTRGAKVKLDNPEITLRGVALPDSFYFGVKAFSVKRGTYDLRRPRYRPFFRPGGLEPRICRVLVNLSRAKRNLPFLDPFSGSGGLVIEASMIGCQAMGLDIDEKTCHGSLKNLKALKCEATAVLRGDARKLPLRGGSIESMATDPPYGRASSLKKAALRELVQALLVQAENLLKRGGHICFACPSSALDGLSIPKELKLVEKHEMFVHRSLMRSIIVLRRV
ncbi:MAG: THUMP domain-containing protein [Candidatus Nezhaarchaeota archaeon]|nr:THUMP domain-containing protein [Candidatus Nezhaarchaeota archaeon]